MKIISEKIFKGIFIKLKGMPSEVLVKYKSSRSWRWNLLWVLLLIFFLFSGSRQSTKGLSNGAYVIIMIIIVSIVRRIRPWLIRKWHYFQEKPSAPYIIFFMLLLLSCAFFVMFKLEPVAEWIANIAYLVLVIGVGIEFCQLIKQKKEEKPK